MKVIIVFILIMNSAAAIAGWSSSTGTVTNVYSHNGSHVIRTTLTDNVCSAGAFWWPADDPDAKDMFALALAALMSDKKISVVYSDSNPDCQHGNSAKITHMLLRK
jgi:hypothetical protein